LLLIVDYTRFVTFFRYSLFYQRFVQLQELGDQRLDKTGCLESFQRVTQTGAKTDDKHHYQAMLLTTNGNSHRVAIVILWANGLILQTKEMKLFRSQQ